MRIAIAPIELGNVVPGAFVLPSHERGVNETFIGEIDVSGARIKAYIKVVPGKQLINEIVATTIGRSLGFPIPQGYLLNVRPEDLPESELLRKHDQEALIFGSHALTHPTFAKRFCGNLDESAVSWLRANFKRWDDTVIFDDWIANGDRHANNLLISSDGVWLIDHSHSFTGPDWKAEHLRAREPHTNQVADIFIPPLRIHERLALKKKAGDLSSIFAKLDGNAVMSACFADRILSSDEHAALFQFLKERVDHIVSIVCERIGFPLLGVKT